MNAFGLAPLLIILPFAGFLLNALVGRRFIDYDRRSGEKWSGWIGAGAAIGTFGVTVALILSLLGDFEHVEIITLFEWINIPIAGAPGAFRVPWALQIDTLSVAMLLVVTGVGSLIHVYAIGYMHGDPDFSRFFAYLNLFLFFMIMLVTGSSYLVLFVGWEGVGLASFLLIGFWFGKGEKDDAGVSLGTKNSNAARKAMIANRVGDFAIIIAMIMTFWTFGTMDFQPVFEGAVELFREGAAVTLPGGATVPIGQMLAWITGLLLLGAAGKSAQLPLFIWLPDAMAGPTPVSALMHAATMVTSGIYLIVRSNVLFEVVRESGDILWLGVSSPDLVALTGAVTAVWAGLIAFTQFDIKKVLAYSTVSQLGFMIAAAGMGAYVAAMFHLITHAFFKALLFLGAGSVIHGVEHGHHAAHDHHAADEHGHHPADDAHTDFDPQDMRFMGGLIRKMPITSYTYIVGALALAGIVPLAGFWSKDEILAHAGNNPGWAFTTVSILLTIAAVCTAFYMGRQLKMVFFGAPRHEASEHAHESPPVMTRPLVILAVLSIVGGFVLNQPYFIADNAPAHGGHSEEAESHEGLAPVKTADLAVVLAAEEGKDPVKDPKLFLEHWLEPSIEAFHLTEEGVVHLPVTPIVLDYGVAALSTALAVIALAGAFFFVYRDRPKNATDPDPLTRTPIWVMARLPYDSLIMKGAVPAFNRFADFCGHVVDWRFYHDWFHERLIRGTFLRVSDFTSEVLDRTVVDNGLVLGSGRLVRGISGVFRQLQTGYVRNYALGLFVGVVALLLFFVFS